MCNNLPHGIDILAGNDLFYDGNSDVCAVVTRSQSAAERSASITPVDTSVVSPVSDQNVTNSLSDSVENVTPLIDNDNCDLDLSLLFENSTTLPISSVVAVRLFLQ